MGPGGSGPMTRRGAGYCAGFAAPGCANPAEGRGSGMAGAMLRGAAVGGRGWRTMFRATGLPRWMRGGGWTKADGSADPQREAQALSDRAGFLQRELDAVRERLAELQKDQDRK